jgi:ribosome biogenesis protein ENP2
MTIRSLGLDHLIGTPTLKPYMHGYFLSLKLYDAARVIANPFAYAEHREKMVREKMEKMAETRIRTEKDAGVKVNRALADKILRDEERARKRAEKRHSRMAELAEDGNAMEVDHDHMADDQGRDKPNLLNDPRFARLFEDPDFAVDENTREYALMNPSAVARGNKLKTAVEEEEDESDKSSSDGLGESESEDDDKDDGGSDSSEAGGEPSKRVRGQFTNHTPLRIEQI